MYVIPIIYIVDCKKTLTKGVNMGIKVDLPADMPIKIDPPAGKWLMYTLPQYTSSERNVLRLQRVFIWFLFTRKLTKENKYAIRRLIAGCYYILADA